MPKLSQASIRELRLPVLDEAEWSTTVDDVSHVRFSLNMAIRERVGIERKLREYRQSLITEAVTDTNDRSRFPERAAEERLATAVEGVR